MSEHLDLFGLLRGELSNAEAIAAGDHLAGCATCQEELADAVVGHSLLTRAGATLGTGAAEASPRPLVLPPRAHRWRATALVAAAAVAVAGVVGGAIWWRSDDATGGAGVEATLAPLPDSGAGSGSDGRVRMVEHDGRTRMTLAVHDLPRASSGEFYYAWLLDPATNKMLPLGQVDPATGTTFDLADSLVTSYSAVDVSLESDDGDPAHSVTSVLRGTYEPAQITTAEGKQG
jgi:hypothetical protein